ncbi:hypothetical protein GGR58DRAFT_470581 [Xylaria digitata]|nr:hypothetical protein GGR58DRAFT_470581 [Xylaria digitata]
MALDLLISMADRRQRQLLTADLASTSSEFALTTIYTPPPECTSPVVLFSEYGDCLDHGCTGNFAVAYASHFHATPTTLSCFPLFTTDAAGAAMPVSEYNPGRFCPLGMTIAANDTINNTICCPSGLTCVQGNDGVCAKCGGSLSTAVMFGLAPSGNLAEPTSLLDSSPMGRDVAIQVLATPITLIGDSLGETSSSIGTPAAKGTSNLSTSSSANPSTDRASRGTTSRSESPTSTSNGVVGLKPIEIGAGIGGALVFILLLILIGFLAIRYRRKRLHDRALLENGSREISVRNSNDLSAYLRLKSELDAAAVRAELEGTPVEERGPGIHVLKPELEGTPGISNLPGVYVRKKAELENHDPSA